MHERNKFNEHYGAYMEMFYLITQGDFTKMEQVEKWQTERFLYQAEYLLRKRWVESLE